MSCEEAREALGGYVLGALDPDERAVVAAHLGACPECAAEHARLAALPALLQHADGLVIPPAPAAVEERLLDRVARERGTPRTRRWRPALRLPRGRALAVACALAGLLVGAGATALALRAGGEDADTTVAQYELRLTGAGSASGRAELDPERGGTEVHLWVEGLAPGAESVYEVRCERAGWSASAGTFRADARGRAYVVLTTAARVGEYERIRVVRREGAGRESPVMSAEIQ